MKSLPLLIIQKKMRFVYTADTKIIHRVVQTESSGSLVDEGMRDIDAKIRQKELARLKEIAALAINSADALNNIFALN